ncbi:hypothetical protein V2J09_007044 [Rumex salicifolius]
MIMKIRLLLGLFRNPRPENQEAYSVSGDGGQEHAAVKRHDGEHHQVREPGPEGVHQGTGQPGGDVVGPGLDEAAIRQPAPFLPGHPSNRTSVFFPQKKVMCIIIPRRRIPPGNGDGAAAAPPPIMP